MINLVKNELIKIFHKKGIWILVMLILGFWVLSFALDSLDIGSQSEEEYLRQSYELYKNTLNDYDLEDKSQAALYAEHLARTDTFALLLDYSDFESPEYYFIDNDIYNVLNNMYYAKYVTKIENEYQVYKKEYDEMIKKLENFDWKNDLENTKKEYLSEIKELEDEKKISTSVDIDNQIETLNIMIKAIDYRLENEIPVSYRDSSYLVDDYETSAISYISMNKDESKYTSQMDLKEKRDAEEKYKIAEYKLENKQTDDRRNLLIDGLVNLFTYEDTVILLGLLIICGGVIADEFSKGTIKQLLVKPFSRNKILASKMIASLIAVALFMLFYYSINVFSYLVQFNDFKALFDTVVDYNFNTHQVFEMNLLSYCFINFLAVLPKYLILFAFTMFMGVLTTNTVGAIASGFGLYFLADFIGFYISDRIAACLPMYCWDFSSYLFGGIALNPYSTLGKSVVICLVTLVVLVMAAFVIFKKKDIKNQ